MDKVFRGDSRSATDLEKTGFQTWVADLSIEDRRDYLRLWAGVKKLTDCSKAIQDKAKNKTLAMDPLVTENKPRNPLDLMRIIIAKKDRTRPTISTDPKEDCGGYDEGFIHTIDTKHMKQVDWAKAVADPNLKPTKLWPSLWLDADTLEKASSIAIYATIGTTREFTFFTHIPYGKISSTRPAAKEEPKKATTTTPEPTTAPTAVAKPSTPTVAAKTTLTGAKGKELFTLAGDYTADKYSSLFFQQVALAAQKKAPAKAADLETEVKAGKLPALKVLSSSDRSTLAGQMPVATWLKALNWKGKVSSGKPAAWDALKKVLDDTKTLAGEQVLLLLEKGPALTDVVFYGLNLGAGPAHITDYESGGVFEFKTKAECLAALTLLLTGARKDWLNKKYIAFAFAPA